MDGMDGKRQGTWRFDMKGEALEALFKIPQATPHVLQHIPAKQP